MNRCQKFRDRELRAKFQMLIIPLICHLQVVDGLGDLLSNIKKSFTMSSNSQQKQMPIVKEDDEFQDFEISGNGI